MTIDLEALCDKEVIATLRDGSTVQSLVVKSGDGADFPFSIFPYSVGDRYYTRDGEEDTLSEEFDIVAITSGETNDQ